MPPGSSSQSMAFINRNDEHENWLAALSLWNQVANWARYQTSDFHLKNQIKALLICLWNEKDWLKKQYPAKSKEIELFIDNSEYIKVIGDLANSVKHRSLDKKPRSKAIQTTYFGRVTLSRNRKRRLYFIDLGDNKHCEILDILRGGITEFEKLKFSVTSDPV